MKHLKLLIILFLTSPLCLSQERNILLDSLFKQMAERGQFSGNILIAENNELTFRKSYGLANRETGTKLNNETLFNTGSVSKAFTAIAILQLNEEEKLSLQDPVAKYIPEFPYPAISLHHLLIHAGGLPDDGIFLDKLDKNTPCSNQDIFRLLYAENPELAFTPGSNSKYNNLGYMLLAEVVQKVSGMKFKNYLQENIFTPAKMTRTGIYTTEEIKTVKNVAKGYLLYPFTGKYHEANMLPEFSSVNKFSGFQGDGNVYSTTGDLFRFYQALSENILLTSESLKTAFQKHIPAKMKGTPDFGHFYGYGWLIMNAPINIVSRGGELPGYYSQTLWNLTDKRLIIYLSNDYLTYTSYLNQIPYSIGGIYRSGNLQVPKLWASVELTKTVVNYSPKELKEKIQSIRQDSENYQIDLPGLQFLVMKLRQMNMNEKALLIEDSFRSEKENKREKINE